MDGTRTTEPDDGGRAAIHSRRVAILVMGVGRSGTSVLARMVGILGATLPTTVLGPGTGNERGHWEPARLVELNDEILRVHGGNWWAPAPIPCEWFSGLQARDFALRAARIIGTEFGNATLLVLKDPRLCRLAPLYFEALSLNGIEPRIILPVRHPDEVIRSVVARDGMDPHMVERIWIRDMLDAEAASRTCLRVWTSFASLLSDWRATAEATATALNLAWPNSPETVAAEIEAAIEPNLRHFDNAADHATTEITPLAIRLWQAALRGLAGDEATLRAEFDAVRAVADGSDWFAAPSAASSPTTALPLTDERLVPSASGAIVLEHLHRYAIAAELVTGKDVLDIASGEGYGTNLLATRAHSVVGVDLSGEAICHARQKYIRPNVHFRQGNCTAIPIPDRSVDVVVSFETIEHLVEQEKFASEVRRVLRPGGIFIVSTPDRAVYSGQLGVRNPFHPRELNAREFAELLRGTFTHAVLMSQRVALGSYVTALDGGATVEAGTHRGDFDTMRFTPGLAEGVYLIGVASDAPLPPLRAGLFEFGRETGGRFAHPLTQLLDELAEAQANVASAERWQRKWYKRFFHRWRPKKRSQA